MASGFDILGPAGFAFAIVPTDTATTLFAIETRRIYVGGAGDIVAEMFDPVTNKLALTTFKAVPVGTTLEIKTKRIAATGTAATFLVGLA